MIKCKIKLQTLVREFKLTMLMMKENEKYMLFSSIDSYHYLY